MYKSLNEVPLIPRSALFGPAARRSAQISPDGLWLTWLAPLNGVVNIWLAPRSKPENARAITVDCGRGINNYFWGQNSRHVIYLQDHDGNEMTCIYAVDIQDNSLRNLTPQTGCKFSVSRTSPLYPDKLLIASNQRDARYHDLYLLDLLSGESELVIENPDFAGFICDRHFRPRIALKPQEDGGRIAFIRTSEGEWDELFHIATEDARVSHPLHLDAEGEILYLVDSRDRDTAALVALKLENGQRQILAEHPQADIRSVLVDNDSLQPLAYDVEFVRSEFYVLDSSIQPDIEFLNNKLTCSWSLNSRTRDDRYWVVAVNSDNQPLCCYLYDRQDKKLSLIFHARPELEKAPLASMYPLVVNSRDGLALVSYLTLPVYSDAGSLSVKPIRPLPLVLLVHGGPWARDSFGFNSYHQWLSNRGYAVLSVNFRGSVGFGKEFINAADGQWGQKMDEDLHDVVDHLIKQGFIDANAIAIMGGSYGGYAVLSGLTRTPLRYRCGIDIVGPSNLATLISTIPVYWESVRTMLYKALGNPQTTEGLAQIKDRSPLHRAGKIRSPLLIGQGANDPRVTQLESDQMVEAMKSTDTPVIYALYPDEGHGFHRPANNISFNTLVELFLAKYLGGRSQPFDIKEVAGMSLQLKESADWLDEQLPAGLSR